MWRAADLVTTSTRDHSERARRVVRAQVDRAEGRLRIACEGAAPLPFTAFQSRVERVLRTPTFGDSELDSVLRAWLRWGRVVGAPKEPQRVVEKVRRCGTELLPHVDVSYRIWWKWTDTGKAWWITVTFDNRTDDVLWGDLNGTAAVTLLLPDPFGWEPGPRRSGPGHDAALMWGGSSADVIQVRPGVVTEYVAPDADVDVHTTADGTLRVTSFHVGLGTNHLGCSIPVRQDV
jgi:hypothetical protein